MSLDSTILKLFRKREKYDLYRHSVPQHLLVAQTQIIVKDLGEYFEESGAQEVDPDIFLDWFLLKHPRLKDEPRALLTGIIKNMGGEVPEAVERGLLARLEDAKNAMALTSLLERYNAGDEVSVTRSLIALAEKVPVSSSELPEAEFSIDKMLDDEENDWGFHWPLDALNQSMRPARPGDFGILAARVDQGKTSFIAHALSHFAPQVDKLFPGEDRNIIVLNNEGLGSRLNQRLVQATLNMSIDEMVEARRGGRNLWDDMIEKWGGRRVVTVYDVHDRPMSYLENIIRRTNPAIVVVDMLDNVPFDGEVGNGGQRTDQILEAAYQRARIWGVKYRTVVLAASQLSAEAAGCLYPGLHQLSNSRTGKAGAAEFVLMLGHSSEEALKHSRWISLPKNKMARAKAPKDPRIEVTFDGARSRFLNPTP